MIFDITYDEFTGEPQVIMELSVPELVTLSSAMFKHVQDSAEWVAEQDKDEHFATKLMVLTEKAGLHGSIASASDKAWQEYEHWDEYESSGICDDCINAMIDEQKEKEDE